jgi:hypothetical protein
VEHRAQVALLLLLVAVGDDRRTQHAHTDRVEDPRNLRAPDLLVANDLLDRSEALPAILLGPGHAGQAALCELALPNAPGGDDLVLVGGARIGAPQDGRFGGVLLQPRAHLRAVRGLLGCVVEIHGCSLLHIGLGGLVD